MSYNDNVIIIGTNNDGTHGMINKRKKDKTNNNSYIVLFFLSLIIIALIGVLLLDKDKDNNVNNKNNLEASAITDQETAYSFFNLDPSTNLNTAREIESLPKDNDKKCYIDGDLAWDINIDNGKITYTTTNERTGNEMQKTLSMEDCSEFYYDINGDGQWQSNESLIDTGVLDVANILTLNGGNITLKNVKITNQGNVVVNGTNVEVGTYNSYKIYKHVKIDDNDKTYYYFKDKTGQTYTLEDDVISSDQIAKNNGKYILNKETEINLSQSNDSYITIYENGK